MTASAAIGARSPLQRGPRALRRAGRLALLKPPGAPPVPAHVVTRPRLAGLLAEPGAAQMTVLVAPAGYGKTTLASQWAAADKRPVAWVALDPADNAPGRLEVSVALAVERGVEADCRTG